MVTIWQSFEPEHDAGEFHKTQECGGEFVIARSDAPPLLEFGEKAFDAPAVPISDFVVSVLISAMAAGRE